MKTPLMLASLVLAATATERIEASTSPNSSGAWDARKAEHLFNRAGFGARPAEIAAAVALGQKACVERLLAGKESDYEPFWIDDDSRPSPREMQDMAPSERQEMQRDHVRHDHEELAHFAGWWIERMLDAKDPLRERMTLFWHGYFTSSMRDVRSSAAMIRQNELFRTHALGSFADLLHAIVRDPAMLAYLDNDKNKKLNPNENFARESMELFSLGEGNYTEKDVKEAARALTGWVTRDGHAIFLPRNHDSREKTILGVTKDFDADQFVDLLLEQPACPKWVARKLLVSFEGREPSTARIEDYAKFLKASNWRIDAFLKRLFDDPEFYSDDVIAARISSPIEYLVGSSRRLGLEPPPVLLWLAAGQLGQRLFDPPNVKGWDGGTAWITTSTLMQRGNMAGMLLGVVKLDDVIKPDLPEVESEPEDPTMSDGPKTEAPDAPPDAKSDPQSDPKSDRPAKKKIGAARKGGPKARGGQANGGPEINLMRRLLGEVYRPSLNLTARCERLGVKTDAEIVDTLSSELLPVALSSESRATLRDFLAKERAKVSIDDGKLLAEHRSSEDLLRRLAHLILSLPEAQLE